MGRGDVTYLESLMDHISTLPADVRRNLQLIQDIDKTSVEAFEKMIKEQQDYVREVEEKIISLEVCDNGTKVRVLGDGDKRPGVIPTTEELSQYVHDLDAMQRIEAVQENAIQLAEEKVSIADQSLKMVDNVCVRIDSDIEEMKKLLQSNGGFQAPGTAKTDDLAAVQLVLGAPEWILAKVITHDPNTGMYRLSDEDTESNKIFNLPENQVIILGGLKTLSRGDTVFAVYPDTTSFYQATVVQTPRKVSGNSSFAMVQFVDDSDEHGITHEKAVLLRHVMRPPYGATLH